MSEFVDFCKKWTKKYVSSYNSGDVKFTKSQLVYFIKSKRYHKVKILTLSPRIRTEEDFRKSFNACYPDMFLAAFLIWPYATGDDISKDISFDTQSTYDTMKAELVMIDGKGRNDKENFHRIYEIDDNRKLHRASEKMEHELSSHDS